MATDEGEAALEAESPDVAGLAQAGSFYRWVSAIGSGCCLHFLDHNLRYGSRVGVEGQADV